MAGYVYEGDGRDKIWRRTWGYKPWADLTEQEKVEEDLARVRQEEGVLKNTAVVYKVDGRGMSSPPLERVNLLKMNEMTLLHSPDTTVVICLLMRTNSIGTSHHPPN